MVMDWKKNGEKRSSKPVEDAALGDQGDRHLSTREEAVLNLLAWGYTNKEAAAKLSLSVKTIDTYRLRLVRKLGLTGRVDMVAYVIEHGGLHQRP